MYVGSGASGAVDGEGEVESQGLETVAKNETLTTRAVNRSAIGCKGRPPRGQVANRQTRFLPSRATQGRVAHPVTPHEKWDVP